MPRGCFNARYPTPIALDYDNIKQSMPENTNQSISVLNLFCLCRHSQDFPPAGRPHQHHLPLQPRNQATPCEVWLQLIHGLNLPRDCCDCTVAFRLLIGGCLPVSCSLLSKSWLICICDLMSTSLKRSCVDEPLSVGDDLCSNEIHTCIRIDSPACWPVSLILGSLCTK
jgi:hypothetical protein